MAILPFYPSLKVLHRDAITRDKKKSSPREPNGIFKVLKSPTISKIDSMYTDLYNSSMMFRQFIFLAKNIGFLIQNSPSPVIQNFYSFIPRRPRGRGAPLGNDGAGVGSLKTGLAFVVLHV